MTKSDVSLLEQLPPGWKNVLNDRETAETLNNLSNFLESETEAGRIFPPKALIFHALALCPFEAVSVVILGQDPYHGEGQAHGLSFSVPSGMKLPPSLKNIFVEIEADMGYPPQQDGNLSRWANQGVLLLNAVLTVREQEARSHRKSSWPLFSRKIIQALNEQREGLVFILWGNDARKNSAIIDSQKHLILESGHPSPLSYRHFRDNKHFSQTNHYLISKGKQPIDWR